MDVDSSGGSSTSPKKQRMGVGAPHSVLVRHGSYAVQRDVDSTVMSIDDTPSAVDGDSVEDASPINSVETSTAKRVIVRHQSYQGVSDVPPAEDVDVYYPDVEREMCITADDGFISLKRSKSVTFVDGVTIGGEEELDEEKAGDHTVAAAAPVIPPTVPAHLADWTLPLSTGRYELQEVVGSGSYGQVVRAMDRTTGKLVAIKRVKNLFYNRIDAKRILREVVLLRQLSHPNVIKLVDLLAPKREDRKTFDELYIVFEYIKTDMEKLLRLPVFLSHQQVAGLMLDLLRGVRFLHSAEVVHRDLKPANLLFDTNSPATRVKVCDFGLGRELRPSELAPPSPQGATVLTGATAGAAATKGNGGAGAGGVGAGADGGSEDTEPVMPRRPPPIQRQLTAHVASRWYRAPELILMDRGYTTAIDVWSVGCIFGELLSMQYESVRFVEQRGPMFPGASCFPLSPRDNPNAYLQKYDQLNVILDVIGSHFTERELLGVSNDHARLYLRHLPARDPERLEQRFPGADTSAMDLLRQMLRFDPRDRITIAEAMRHPFLVKYAEEYDPAEWSEPAGGVPVNLGFDSDADLSRDDIRALLLAEIARFHPEVLNTAPPPPPPRRGSGSSTTSTGGSSGGFGAAGVAGMRPGQQQQQQQSRQQGMWPLQRKDSSDNNNSSSNGKLLR